MDNTTLPHGAGDADTGGIDHDGSNEGTEERETEEYFGEGGYTGEDYGYETSVTADTSAESGYAASAYDATMCDSYAAEYEEDHQGGGEYEHDEEGHQQAPHVSHGEDTTGVDDHPYEQPHLTDDVDPPQQETATAKKRKLVSFEDDDGGFKQDHEVSPKGISDDAGSTSVAFVANKNDDDGHNKDGANNATAELEAEVHDRRKRTVQQISRDLTQILNAIKEGAQELLEAAKDFSATNEAVERDLIRCMHSQETEARRLSGIQPDVAGATAAFLKEAASAMESGGQVPHGFGIAPADGP